MAPTVAHTKRHIVYMKSHKSSRRKMGCLISSIVIVVTCVVRDWQDVTLDIWAKHCQQLRVRLAMEMLT